MNYLLVLLKDVYAPTVLGATENEPSYLRVLLFRTCHQTLAYSG